MTERSRATVLFWGLFSLTLLFYLAIVLWALPKVSHAAGGLTPFDLRLLGYSAAEAQAFLDTLTDDGRRFYLGTQRRLDTVFPALLCLTLSWATLWAYRNCSLAWRGLLICPAIALAAFDYFENAQVAALLTAPSVDVEMIFAASAATIGKSLATTVAMVVLLIGIAMHLWAKKGDDQ